MPEILSINNIVFTLWDYPMSYLELVGTLLTLVSVWLVVKRNIWTWPIGIIGATLYMLLFYQVQLYSDTIEQVYYLATGVYGWMFWKKATQDGAEVRVMFSSHVEVASWAVMTILFTWALGTFISDIHHVYPSLFPEPASYPYLDALTTVMSLVAQWLMLKKRVECWVYWILVDIIGIGLYWSKGVIFVAALYVVLLVMASRGLMLWWETRRRQDPERIFKMTRPDSW
jgi:nicotinamide mononucleotide transporter